MQVERRAGTLTLSSQEATRPPGLMCHPYSPLDGLVVIPVSHLREPLNGAATDIEELLSIRKRHGLLLNSEPRKGGNGREGKRLEKENEDVEELLLIGQRHGLVLNRETWEDRGNTGREEVREGRGGEGGGKGREEVRGGSKLTSP